MNEFEKILEKMKLLLRLEKEADVAIAIGLKPSAFSNRKKTESIPFSHYLKKARSLNVNLNWLLYDKGPMFISNQDQVEDKTNIIDPAVQILHEAIKETGVELNEKQKQAFIEIISEELEKSDRKTKEDIKKYLRAFGE